MNEYGECLFCGARTKSPARGLPPLMQCAQCAKKHLQSDKTWLEEARSVWRGETWTDPEAHYDDVVGYYQGSPLLSDPRFNGFSAPRNNVALAVRTGPCHHKWGPWKRSGGRFDHRGDIETIYSRWCEKCREGEEQRMSDRLGLP